MGYIRRKRHLSQPVQDFLENPVKIKAHEAVSVLHNLQNLRLKKAVSKLGPRTGAELFAGSYQCFPDDAVSAVTGFFPSGDSLKEQDLHCPAGALSCAEEPCRYDAGVVQDQRIAGAKVLRYIGENPVLERLCFSVRYKEPCLVPVRERILRNQFLRQVVVIIGCLKAGHFFPAGR